MASTLFGRLLRRPKAAAPPPDPPDPWSGAGWYNRRFRPELEAAAEEISSPHNPVTTRGNPEGCRVEFVRDGQVIATTRVQGEFQSPYAADIWAESDELFARLEGAFRGRYPDEKKFSVHRRDAP